MGSILNPSVMDSIKAVPMARRAQGMATIMAIGTAHPPKFIEQSEYTDFLFGITDTEHKVELKEKFRRICQRTMISKRYFHHDEEYLKQHPNICKSMGLSLNDRQDVCVVEVPKLGKEAAVRALEEWGRPKSLITHLIFCTSCGVDMPSADFRLATILGLRPDVSRYCVYMQGCYAGGTVIRYAKDLAENNRDARILVVCAEMTVIGFRAPHQFHVDNAVGTAIFGDGAAALVVGSDPIEGVEKPIFEIVCAKQRFIPDTEEAIHLHLREEGMLFSLSKDTPEIISNNIDQCLADVFESMGMKLPSDWNSLFWLPHPGGRAILDAVEARLKLHPEKFQATRHILWEYGNMISVCVLYIMDQMRKKSADEGLATTGEGLEWGVLQGFGPGMTIETVLLRSVPI